MYPLFETIRINNGLPCHLEWHHARLSESWFRHYKCSGAPDPEEIIKVPEEYKNGVVKCRLMYGKKGTAVDFSNYSPRKIRTLRLVADDGIDYSMKYTDRSSLQDLLKLRGTCDEILIVKNGLVTDTSYTNIVFFDGLKWVTPASPLLQGTCRNRLLHEGLITEGNIRPRDLPEFKTFRLINAMLDFKEQKAIDVINILV